jgi:hypothetical protein
MQALNTFVRAHYGELVAKTTSTTDPTPKYDKPKPIIKRKYTQRYYERLQREQCKREQKTYTEESIEPIYASQSLEPYDISRKNEYCETLASLLHEKLQTGFAKEGELNGGQCPFPIFDFAFGPQMQENVKRTCRVTMNTIDGVKEPQRTFTYKFPGGLPFLGVGLKWYTRDHGLGNGRFTCAKTSRYYEIILTIEEKFGRVTVFWKQHSLETDTSVLIY